MKSDAFLTLTIGIRYYTVFDSVGTYVKLEVFIVLLSTDVANIKQKQILYEYFNWCKITRLVNENTLAINIEVGDIKNIQNTNKKKLTKLYVLVAIFFIIHRT